MSSTCDYCNQGTKNERVNSIAVLGPDDMHTACFDFHPACFKAQSGIFFSDFAERYGTQNSMLVDTIVFVSSEVWYKFTGL